MPVLTNQRQERFCQLIKQGIPPYRAYPMAGYKPHNGAPYRLCENVRIKRRLAELTRHIAVKTRVTIETITEQLLEDREFARSVEQSGPAMNATIAIAKLHGLIVDRKESGGPGDFAGLQTPDEVLDLIRNELGDEAADALAGVITKQDVEDAGGKGDSLGLDASDEPALTHDGSDAVN